MFLTCCSRTIYWQRVTEKINDSLGTSVVLTPALCLLNSLKGNEGIRGKKAHWLRVALITAKRVVLKHWTGANNPTFFEWLAALSENASYEHLIYKINGRIDTYREVWDPLLTQIREMYT